jgi:hypothetical protein
VHKHQIKKKYQNKKNKCECGQNPKRVQFVIDFVSAKKNTTPVRFPTHIAHDKTDARARILTVITQRMLSVLYKRKLIERV